jgi:hypothetical protein
LDKAEHQGWLEIQGQQALVRMPVTQVLMAIMALEQIQAILV